MRGLIERKALVLLALAGCGRSEPYQWPSAATPGTPPFSQAPRYYNQRLGRALDGSQAQFPAVGDPTVVPAAEPDLRLVAAVLGQWLGRYPPPDNGYWTSPAEIPASWAERDETAIVYRIESGAGRQLRGTFGVDNGIFIWVNGVYRFGAVEPGGAPAGEYPNVDLGPIPEGASWVQVLREDHGITNGFQLRLEVTP